MKSENRVNILYSHQKPPKVTLKKIVGHIVVFAVVIAIAISNMSLVFAEDKSTDLSPVQSISQPIERPTSGLYVSSSSTKVVSVASAKETQRKATPEMEKAAGRLNQIGFLSGSGVANGKPNYELEKTPTRAECFTFLVKLTGSAKDAEQGVYNHPFTDVPKWADKYVGYAYSTGLTSGTSPTTFGSNDPVTLQQFCTMLLRALGYSDNQDFKYDTAIKSAVEKGILTQSQADEAKSAFLRGDMALLADTMLTLSKKGYPYTYIEGLIKTQAVTSEAATAAGYITADGKTPPKSGTTAEAPKSDGDLVIINKPDIIDSNTLLYIEYNGNHYTNLPLINPGMLQTHEDFPANQVIWTTSDKTILEVKDTKDSYGSKGFHTSDMKTPHGVLAYARKAGTVTLTLSDGNGKTIATLQITIAAPKSTTHRYQGGYKIPTPDSSKITVKDNKVTNDPRQLNTDRRYGCKTDAELQATLRWATDYLNSDSFKRASHPKDNTSWSSNSYLDKAGFKYDEATLTWNTAATASGPRAGKKNTTGSTGNAFLTIDSANKNGTNCADDVRLQTLLMDILGIPNDFHGANNHAYLKLKLNSTWYWYDTSLGGIYTTAP